MSTERTAERHPWQRPTVTTVTVNRRITVTFTGSEPAFIAAADAIAPGGLDSLDAGDAVGAFVDAADRHRATGSSYPYALTRPDVGVSVDYDDDLYEWNPAPVAPPAESPVLAAIREAIALGLDGESIAGIDLLLTRFPHLAP